MSIYRPLIFFICPLIILSQFSRPCSFSLVTPKKLGQGLNQEKCCYSTRHRIIEDHAKYHRSRVPQTQTSPVSVLVREINFDLLLILFSNTLTTCRSWTCFSSPFLGDRNDNKQELTRELNVILCLGSETCWDVKISHKDVSKITLLFLFCVSGCDCGHTDFGLSVSLPNHPSVCTLLEPCQKLYI